MIIGVCLCLQTVECYPLDMYPERYGWDEDDRIVNIFGYDGKLVPGVEEIGDGSRAESPNDSRWGRPPTNCVRLSRNLTDIYCAFTGGSGEDWLAEKDLPTASCGRCELS